MNNFKQVLIIKKLLDGFNSDTTGWDQKTWRDYEFTREQLNAELKKALRFDLNSYSKKQIFVLLALCSAYRPEALHSILGRFSDTARKENYL